MIRKARLTALVRNLIRINSENPPGRELACGQFIEKDMRAAGLVVRRFAFAKDRPNIVATLKGSWPRARAAREALLLTPHFDTVPLGKGWKYDPLGGQVVKGRIYGRGASDDKGNAACCMEAMRSLVEDGVVLKRDVIMAATVDEETGSHEGIIPLLDKKILRPKAALIVDSDGFDTIIAQKGLIHSRVQIFGKKAHGAYNWRGINAIEVAAEVIGRLRKHRFAYRRHPLLHPPTVNVGVISGGDKVNMVPDFCEFALDVRFLPGMSSAVVIREVKAIIRGVTRRFKFVIDDLQQPYEIDREHPFVRTYVEAAKKLGTRAHIMGSNGATVITFFKKHRIPAFATGFGSHGTAHTNDEYAELDMLYRGAKTLERFVKDYDAQS